MTATNIPDRIKRESKKCTHDGWIWPFTRDAMITQQNIRKRMAEDLRTMLQQRGMDAVVTTEDYLRLGWTRGQVIRHGLAAGRLLTGENGCGNDASALGMEVA